MIELKGCIGLVVLLMLAGSAYADSVEVSPIFLKYSAYQGELVNQQVTLLNHGNPSTFFVNVVSDHSFIILDRSDIFVESSATFIAILDTSTLGIHVGSLLMDNAQEQHVVPVLLEVESPSPNFDIALQTSEETAIRADGMYTADITIYNLHAPGNQVALTYALYDSDGIMVLSEKQSFTVDQQLAFTKSFPLPSRLTPGTYIFAVSASDGITVGTSASFFTLASAPLTSPSSGSGVILFFASLVIALIVVMLLLNRYWDQQLVSTADHWSNKVHAMKEGSFSTTRKHFEHLMYQRELLRKAYERGYIKKEHYTSGTDKIDTAIKSLKKRL